MRPSAPGIDLSADLKGEFEGKPFSLTASGRQIFLDFTDLASCLKVVRQRPAGRPIRHDLARLTSFLNDMELTLELRIDGNCIAVTGFEMHATIASLLGFRQLKLYPLAIFKSALRWR